MTMWGSCRRVWSGEEVRDELGETRLPGRVRRGHAGCARSDAGLRQRTQRLVGAGSTLVSGSVRYNTDWPGLLAEEKEAGLLLPCCAHAQSDLVVQFGINHA